MNLITLAERGLLPDWLIRLGIRRLCSKRLREERRGGAASTAARQQQRLRELESSPIAVHTAAANAQHYELPPAFFELCLGRQRKYSASWFPNGDETLDQAEDAMLLLCAERAELADGQEILELGCGWGAMTLWMAERFPQCRVTALSNSRLQREFIEARCRERGLANVSVMTADVNDVALPAAHFDRVVSIEMFEHLRNYALLMARIASWLKPNGKLFVHIFCHRELLYAFETEGDDNWLGRHFFTGGLMPAVDTLAHYRGELELQQQWQIGGQHYRQTAEAWLANQDRRRDAVLPLLVATYGVRHARLWRQRWRIFWMACAELFGYAEGREWQVAHYRFAKH